jgi:hypothetical protein
MRVLLTTLSLFFLVGSAHAELTVDMTGAPDSIGIGDVFNVQLTIETPSDGQLLLPDLPTVLEPFELYSQPQISELPEMAGSRRIDMSLEVTCYESGIQAFQPIPVGWESEDGLTTDSTATDPFIIQVQGVVPDSILALTDSTQQVHHLLQPNRGRIIGFSVSEAIPWLLVVLGLVGGYFLIRWLVRKRKEAVAEAEEGPPPIPPHRIALQELDRLRDRKLYQAGEIKLFYSILTDIIRKYIEGRYDVPALESTSFQLLRMIERYLGDEKLQTALQTMLSDADLAKFARHRPDAETCQKDLENGYFLVDNTKPKPPPIIRGEAA